MHFKHLLLLPLANQMFLKLAFVTNFVNDIASSSVMNDSLLLNSQKKFQNPTIS